MRYRRADVAGGTYFFTVNLAERKSDLLVRHIDDLRVFANGEDIHRATAAEIFALTPDSVSSEQRRYAKVINFGLIYGMSVFGLATQLSIERNAACNERLIIA